VSHQQSPSRRGDRLESPDWYGFPVDYLLKTTIRNG